MVLGDRGKPPPAARKGGEPTDANAGFNASQEDMRRAFREKLQRRRHSGDNKVPEDKPQDGRRRSSGDLPVTSAAGGRRGSGVSTASTHAQAVQPLEVRLRDDSSDDEWDDDPGRLRGGGTAGGVPGRGGGRRHSSGDINSTKNTSFKRASLKSQKTYDALGDLSDRLLSPPPAGFANQQVHEPMEEKEAMSDGSDEDEVEIHALAGTIDERLASIRARRSSGEPTEPFAQKPPPVTAQQLAETSGRARRLWAVAKTVVKPEAQVSAPAPKKPPVSRDDFGSGPKEFRDDIEALRGPPPPLPAQASATSKRASFASGEAGHMRGSLKMSEASKRASLNTSVNTMNLVKGPDTAAGKRVSLMIEEQQKRGRVSGAQNSLQERAARASSRARPGQQDRNRGHDDEEEEEIYGGRGALHVPSLQSQISSGRRLSHFQALGERNLHF